MKAQRIGIIGCGNVLSAYRTSIDRLRAEGLAEATVVCGRASQEKSARQFLGAIRFTTDPLEVIKSSEVDVVLVLTSMKEHARLAGAALEEGKHVLVEKPMATTLAEADALLEIAKKSSTFMVCAPFTILSPTFQIMAKRIANGEIGKPCSARGRYGWAGPSWSEWFYKKGGGCLFDLGVYPITSLTGLLGPVKRVMAMTGIAIGEREINGKKIKVEAEDNAQVLLDFGDNNFGVITSGFTIQQYRGPALEIYGTTGSIQMLGDDWDPEGYELWRNEIGAWQFYKETHPDWSWTDGLAHLVECIRTGKKPLATPEHSRHVLEIMLAAQESGKTGKALEIKCRFEKPQFDSTAEVEAAHLMHDRSRKVH